jgi:tyrosyl-tRNA synthetase
VGDFTAVIGDTSDKESERPMLAREVIEKNKQSYFKQAGKILDLSKVETRYNSEWLEKLNYREIGEHADMFSVADFTAREVIKRRLDQGKRVSLREMLYPLMQGYDSVAIKADVELGGMDQKFNLLAGRTMQERVGQMPQDILMNPLIEGLDGSKMSSSRGNYIALTAVPSDMFGKVMSMADAQVETYFNLCTRVPLEEIPGILKMHPKEAKLRLAFEITALYNGQDAAQEAQQEWENTFSKGEMPDEIPETSVASGTSYLEALGALAESKTNLRRLAEQGAIADEHGKKIDDLSKPVSHAVTLRIGKHRFLKIVVK